MEPTNSAKTPRIINQRGMVTDTCKSQTSDADAGGTEVYDYPWLHKESEVSLWYRRRCHEIRCNEENDKIVS